MVDSAREEQDVKDISNFLNLLLKGAEKSISEKIIEDAEKGNIFMFMCVYYTYIYV
jgi:hypothetical protein